MDEFFKRNIEGKLKTAHAIRLRVDKYFIPALGKLRIEKVDPMHISTMLNKITDAGAPTTSNDILSFSKQLFNYAIKRHIIKHNPAAAFNMRDAGGKESSRDRYLTQEELVLLFEAMRASKKFSRHHYLCLKLLILLGCRKEELLSAKISSFDLDASTWKIPVESKSKRAMVVPLAPQALAIVKELMTDPYYLIPAMGIRKSKSPYADVGYLNKPTKQLIPLMGDIENFTLHDLRATMKTHMRAMGVDVFVSE